MNRGLLCAVNICGLCAIESDSESEETTVKVSRPRGVCRRGGVVSSESIASAAPQKGILKDKKAAAMTLTKEEQKKRVRFSLEGKSLADTSDHSDSSSDEDDAAVEMEAGNSDDDEIIETHDLGEISNSGVYVTIIDALDTIDMEDSDDLSEQSDDGYIETESSTEEEMEGESEDEGTTPMLAAASANDGASHTYVPPHLREGRTSKNQERLRKTVQGLINR